MSDKKYGIKTKLILELIIITFCFITAISNKYYKVRFGADFPVFTSWFVIWIVFLIYNKKFNDMIDEFSKRILAKVNYISSQIFIFGGLLVATYFVTPYNPIKQFQSLDVGILILALLFVLCVFRLCLYIYFNRKGIYD